MENNTVTERVNFGQKLGQVALMLWKNDVWGDLQILNRGEYKTPPDCPANRFGHGIFDAFKATVDSQGNVRIFRLPDHLERFKRSAMKMGMPKVDEEKFRDAVVSLVKLYAEKLEQGKYLYICPQLLNVTDDSMKAFAMTEYALHFVACYLQNSDSALVVKIDPDYSRYTETADVKVAGNYGATIAPKIAADKEGCTGVLFAGNNRLQELETSNLFLVIDGKTYTPRLNGEILPGVTRDTIIQISQKEGKEYKVTERVISLNYFLKKLRQGSVNEAWTSGTAVGMSKITEFYYKSQIFTLPVLESSRFEFIRTRLYQAQRGEIFEEFTEIIPV